MTLIDLLDAARAVARAWPDEIPVSQIGVRRSGRIGIKSEGSLSPRQREAVRACGFRAGNSGFWYLVTP